MKIFPFVFVSVMMLSIIGCSKAEQELMPEERDVTRIAFGSCYRQTQPMHLWDEIAELSPSYFLLVGDNVYADTTDPEVMKATYQKLANDVGYQQLKSKSKILAIWDDHDYGADDSGADYPMKKESEVIFENFFKVPDGQTRPNRAGVYDSHLVTTADSHRIQIILLDTRYFRSPLIIRKNRQENESVYLPHTNRSTTILGEEQWKWLAEVLTEPADLRLIVSSIQLLTDGQRGENWLNFPHERQRLFDLIDATNANGVVFLSGDSHFAELSRLDKTTAGYPLYDLTSSSLNQGWDNDGRILPNKNRLKGYYSEDNFGLIEIDWDAWLGPVVSLQIRNDDNDVVIKESVSLKTLKKAK